MRRNHGHAGLAEIADMLGLSKARAHRIMQNYADFPEPVARLRAGGVWHTDEIKAWMTAHPQRRPGRPLRNPQAQLQEKAAQ